MGAALLAKAARSAGEEAAAAQSIALAIKLERLAAIDADALETARTALAAVDDEGDKRRDFKLGQTLSQAAAVPLDVAESCVDVIDLAGFVSQLAPDDLLPDVRAAAGLAAGRRAGRGTSRRGQPRRSGRRPARRARPARCPPRGH